MKDCIGSDEMFLWHFVCFPLTQLIIFLESFELHFSVFFLLTVFR